MRLFALVLLSLTLSACGGTEELLAGAVATVGGCALLDTNDDEAIGGDEAANALFTRYDTNNDAMLSRAEFDTGIARGRATAELRGKFGDWDDNNDAMLSRTEFVDGAGDDDSFVGIADAGCDELGL
jgi:hypothetical protein